MATGRGLGIVTDGLVFYYDTGNSIDSYLGEPTVNIAQTLSTFGTDGSGQASVGTYTQVDGNSNHYKIVDVASNTRVSRTYTSFTAGASYTFSVEFRKLTGTPTLRFQLQGRNSGGLVNIVFPTTAQIGIVDTDGWQRATYTFTPGATSTILYWYIQDGDDYTTYTHSYELRNPQLEQNSHVTPFVNGTRSATQGLLDLTGNNTIDLSNVSFDSNAQMTFDGTDDVITVPMDNLRPSSAITQEVVVELNSNAAQVFIGSQYGTGSNNSYAIWFSAANYLAGGVNIGGSFNYQSQSYTFNSTGTYHLVHTYDGTTQKLYINGELVRSWATSGTIQYDNNNTLLAIGNDWNGSGYDAGPSIATHGKQPITKIYNRALTAAEVKRNYNALKTRFGLI